MNLFGFAFLATLAVSAPAFADLTEPTSGRGFACDDQRTQGWNFYCDPNAVVEEEPEAAAELPPAPPPLLRKPTQSKLKSIASNSMS
ncbi:hypothetical protein QTO30_20820 [Yoonia sp. GPGPB17]|uniref:hypothetical protein n=1 Tax=Yoonia sp. GPGPB17 TaxID=3026147 RepID=UPI0030C3A594